MTINIIGSVRALEGSSPVVPVGVVVSIGLLGAPELKPTPFLETQASALIIRVLVVSLAVDDLVLGKSKNSESEHKKSLEHYLLS